MNQSHTDAENISKENSLNTFDPDEHIMLDYDDQPYGEDNVLVRFSKRRSYQAQRFDFL